MRNPANFARLTRNWRTRPVILSYGTLEEHELDRFIKLALFVGLIYALVVYGKPMIEDALADMDRIGGGGSGGSPCVSAVERATEAFADSMKRFAEPPVTLESWRSARAITDGRIRNARQTCVCEGEMCKLADRALDQLESTADQMERNIKDGNTFNPATGIERVYKLLDQARSAG